MSISGNAKDQREQVLWPLRRTEIRGRLDHRASINRLLAPGGMLIILILHGAASLFHFVHNAVFIEHYPNLPGWITVTGVYSTWICIASVGFTGYLLNRYGKPVFGLVAVLVYGAFGLDGLAHYALAPVSAHTLTMNVTILLESGTAVLVITVAILSLSHRWSAR